MELTDGHISQQQLWNAIFTDSPDLVFIMDAAFRLIMANESFLRVWKDKLDDLIGKGFKEIGFKTQQAEKLEREIKQVIESENPARIGFSYTHDTLGEKLYDCILLPLHDEDEKVKAVAGMARDFTELNRTVHRRSEDRLKAILDGAEAGAWEVNLDEGILWRSVKHDQIFGYDTPVGNWDYERFRNHVLPEDREWVDRKFKRVLEGEGEWDLECRIRRLDGEIRWIWTKGKFIRKENQPVKVAGTTIDITDRKKIEQERNRLLHELEIERRHLNEFFEQSPSYMAILRGPDHVYERVNDHYEKMATKPDVVGKPLREALPELEEQGLVRILDHTYRTGEPFRRNEVPMKIAGQQRYLHVILLPLHNPDGSVNGIFFQGVDVTERKLVQKELEAINATLETRVKERTESLMSKQKQLRLLASKLSKMEEDERQRLASELHDNLGQLLAIAKIKLDQLKRSQIAGEIAVQVNELSEIMTQSIRYTRELMTDLKAPPSLNKQNLREGLDWVSEKMKKYNLEVSIEDDGQTKPLSEEVQNTLIRCSRELLFNVVKHSGANEAKISLSREGEKVRVLIDDQGKGFDPEAKLIEEGGFGLFSISERLDLLGGDFEITSEPGKGTKAILTVPVE